MEQRVSGGIDGLYAAPAARREAAPGESLRNRSAVLLGVAFLGALGSLILVAAGGGMLAILPFGAVTCIALAGAVHAGVSFAKTGWNALGLAGSAFLLLLNLGMVIGGWLGATMAMMSFTRGRQIRRFGRVLLPPVAAGDTWTRAPIGAVDVDGPSRDALAAQWRENGRTEHASVAAFARLTLDLVVLGAPPELVASANRDALDEIRHAEQCFALARAIDSRAESPGAFPDALRSVSRARPRAVMLAELAVDSLVDGALNEGASARIVARVARRCAEPEIRAILRAIAADEGRHSAHGWDVVKWCLEAGGAPVAHALAAAARALPMHVRSTLPLDARDGGWERWGIAGAALEADELEKTRADVVRRVEKLVAPFGLAAAA